MFAVQFERFGPPEVLTLGTAPEPHPGPHQVRIAVRTAAVSPVDLALREGSSPASKNLALWNPWTTGAVCPSGSAR